MRYLFFSILLCFLCFCSKVFAAGLFTGDLNFSGFVNAESVISNNIQQGEISLAGEHYADALIRYFVAGEDVSETEDMEDILKDAHKADSTVFFLGVLNGLGWLASNYNNRYSFDDYKEQLQKIYNKINEIDITWNNYQKFLTDPERVSSLISALTLGISAGISYGYIMEPDAKKQIDSLPLNFKPYYSFRVGQQKLREAVLKSYRDQIVREKAELAYLINLMNVYCGLVSTSFDINFNVSGNADIMIIKGDSSGRGIFRYDRIINALRLQTLYLLQGDAEQKKIMCLVYASQLQNAKVLLTLTELNLFNLSAKYSELENDEKKTLYSQ